MPLQVAMPAPRFQAQAYDRAKDDFREITLDEYRGRWLCLYFYQQDFTLVCPTEIVQFNKARPRFQERNCDLLACSTDSKWVHKGWCEAERDLASLAHPMLADPTHRVALDYGVLVPDQGCALRGTFLIDPLGILRWIGIYDLSVGRNVTEILRVLDALQTDALCPCNWHKGDPTMHG